MTPPKCRVGLEHFYLRVPLSWPQCPDVQNEDHWWGMNSESSFICEVDCDEFITPTPQNSQAK